MRDEIAVTVAPLTERDAKGKLSPWWRRASLFTMVLGFSVLILLTVKVHHDAPLIPDSVTGPGGTVLFTADDIRSGQQVFLKYGLMDNGSIWGHGALLGPDFSAEYLHTLTLHGAASVAERRYNRAPGSLSAVQRAMVESEVRTEFKQNRYDPQTRVLAVGAAYEDWFGRQISVWNQYFSDPARNGGLRARTISAPSEQAVPISVNTGFIRLAQCSRLFIQPATACSGLICQAAMFSPMARYRWPARSARCTGLSGEIAVGKDYCPVAPT